MSQFSSEMEAGSGQDDAGRGTQGGVAELGFSTGELAVPAGVPDPELAQTAKRRAFTAKYKLSIVREADACERPGEIGALLRREGLFSELYPDVVDACEEEGGVPSRLLKTDAGDGRQEGTPWRMFAGSLSGRASRTGSRLMVSRARVRVG